MDGITVVLFGKNFCPIIHGLCHTTISICHGTKSFAADSVILKVRLQIKVNVISISLVYVTNLFNVCETATFASYCINATKCLLHAISKKNELTSSPLILHKANILWY